MIKTIYLQARTHMHEYKYFFASTRTQINKKSKDKRLVARNWWKHCVSVTYPTLWKLWRMLNSYYMKYAVQRDEFSKCAHERKKWNESFVNSRDSFRFSLSRTGTYFVSWILEREMYGTPWPATYLITQPCKVSRERERKITGKKTKSWERERGTGGERKNGSTAKRPRSSRSTKARFDGVVVPRLLNLLRPRILVDKPPYGHPTAHPACAKSIVTIDDHLVRRTRACASIYPSSRWRFWRFQNKPIQTRLSHRELDLMYEFTIRKFLSTRAKLNLKCDRFINFQSYKYAIHMHL